MLVLSGRSRRCRSCFGAAARRLRLSTMGILQYLSPTLQFLLAVLAFGEPFSSAQLLSFACIWAAVLIYALDSLPRTRPSPLRSSNRTEREQ